MTRAISLYLGELLVASIVLWLHAELHKGGIGFFCLDDAYPLNKRFLTLLYHGQTLQRGPIPLTESGIQTRSNKGWNGLQLRDSGVSFSCLMFESPKLWPLRRARVTCLFDNLRDKFPWCEWVLESITEQSVSYRENVVDVCALE